LGIHHRRYGHDFSVEDAERGVGGWLATIIGAEASYDEVFLPLHGRHQLTNLAMATAAAEALLGGRLDADSLRDAAAAATTPGRMEPLATLPLVLVDGAHNPDGVEVLVDSLEEEFPTTKWHVMLGVMGDKKVEPMVHRLASVAEGFITTAVEAGRAIPAADLADTVASLVDVPVLAADEVGEALDMARAEAGPTGAVLVTGSLYLVGKVRDLLSD
jgi:dihydrofolate synthase/folylpolyglutamate synthase